MGREGCYSVARQVCGYVPRANAIEIRAWDRFGNPIHERWEGFTARIFQHEIDHLEGIRFPDRVGPNGALHWVEEEDYPEYKKQWENWPHKCSWEMWINMKGN